MMARMWQRAALGGVIAMCLVVAADDKPAANLLKPTADVKNWRFEQHEQAKGKMSVEEDAIVLESTKTDDTDWHLQAFQTKLDLKDAKEYTLTFKAKADPPREVRVQAGIDQEDWHLIGLDETADLPKEWKDFKYTFTVSDSKAGNNRMGFVLGGAMGKVFVKDMVLK